MSDGSLKGKKVAVLIETEYVASEIAYYKEFFKKLGAEVDFLTYMLGKKERVIVSDVTEPNVMPETMTVTKEIADADPDDYAVVLTAANYVACRLREIPPTGSLGCVEKLGTPPAVKFVAKAMKNPKIVKGMLCHSLWILTPVPELLRGRRVICHTVILADVVNAGGVFVPDESHVVVDKDLVTGRSAADVAAYCDAIAKTYEQI